MASWSWSWEGVWRDFYTGEQLENYTKPWENKNGDKLVGNTQNCILFDPTKPETRTWIEWQCRGLPRGCPCTLGGRSWQPYGERKNGHNNFLRALRAWEWRWKGRREWRWKRRRKWMWDRRPTKREWRSSRRPSAVRPSGSNLHITLPLFVLVFRNTPSLRWQYYWWNNCYQIMYFSYCLSLYSRRKVLMKFATWTLIKWPSGLFHCPWHATKILQSNLSCQQLFFAPDIAYCIFM